MDSEGIIVTVHVFGGQMKEASYNYYVPLYMLDFRALNVYISDFF